MQSYDLDDGTTIIEPAASAEAEKSSCRVIQGGTLVDAADTVINFDNGGIYTCTIADGGSNELDVSSLNVGQVGRVHILSGDAAATITWEGVDKWAGGVAPTFTADELTIVTLINDGTQVIGGFTVEAAATAASANQGDLATDANGTAIAAAVNGLRDVLVAQGLMASS